MEKNQDWDAEDFELEPVEIPEREAKRDNGQGRRSGRFGGGFFLGILLTLIVVIGGVTVYCKTTGATLVIGESGGNVVAESGFLDEQTAAKIQELINYVTLYYYEDCDEDTLRDSMYAGLIQGLGDPYSEYYSAKEYEDLQVTTSGTYYGIGAGLVQDSDTMEVTISKVYEGTPSQEAGLREEDVILTVDGMEADSMDVTDLVQLIRGEEGSTVHMEIYRPSTEETLEFDVERRNVELPSVSGQMLEDGIGYIQISEFQKNTAKQFEGILEELEEEGMTSMIIDVRGNPGGLLDSVVDILDIILPEGTVVYIQDKYGNRQDYTSNSACLDYPIAVLMDANSASASEIFAGAIKDYEYGTLIGTTTFGKGIVQSVFPLSSGDALKVTTSKYYTPNGNYIHGVGIDPDIELEYEFLGGEEDVYAIEFDNQIQKAIEVLTGADAE